MGLLCGLVCATAWWWIKGSLRTDAPPFRSELAWDAQGLLWPVHPDEERLFWLRDDGEGKPLGPSCRYSLTVPLAQVASSATPRLPEPWWLASGEAPHVQPRFLLGSVQRFEHTATDRDPWLDVTLSATPSAGVWLPLPPRDPLVVLLVETPQAQALKRVERLFEPHLRRLSCD